MAKAGPGAHLRKAADRLQGNSRRATGTLAADAGNPPTFPALTDAWDTPGGDAPWCGLDPARLPPRRPLPHPRPAGVRRRRSLRHHDRTRDLDRPGEPGDVDAARIRPLPSLLRPNRRPPARHPSRPVRRTRPVPRCVRGEPAATGGTPRVDRPTGVPPRGRPAAAHGGGRRTRRGSRAVPAPARTARRPTAGCHHSPVCRSGPDRDPGGAGADGGGERADLEAGCSTPTSV